MCIRDRPVELLRRHFDRPALTTDLIVGFPGETEGEFAQTLSFLPVSYTHLDVYKRQGEQNGDNAFDAEQIAQTSEKQILSCLLLACHGSWRSQRNLEPLPFLSLIHISLTRSRMVWLCRRMMAAWSRRAGGRAESASSCPA